MNSVELKGAFSKEEDPSRGEAMTSGSPTAVATDTADTCGDLSLCNRWKYLDDGRKDQTAELERALL
ncbi:hypothetical protein JZ751_028780 [Albula glossodonta]|uniref:Uncharacterized protein n=1 Tax=Albula glossodonta TaxID=121402 RepID=A0A8T2NDH9_9TELE|nr:hypothetical protein JZ751_028780 [Albula glossodonta]